MTGLILEQPHASAVVHGVQCYVLRWHSTDYRGDVVVCALDRMESGALDPRLGRHGERAAILRPAFLAAGLRTFRDFPLGRTIGIVRLVDCVPAAELLPDLDPVQLALDPVRWANDELFAHRLEPVCLLDADPIRLNGRAFSPLRMGEQVRIALALKAQVS